MKKLTLVLFLIISAKAFAEDKGITVNELKDTIVNMPEKISNFARDELEKTKKYQLESWAQTKEQLVSSKNKLSGFFSDLNLN